MSSADSRQLIAEQLSSVQGVTGYVYRPSAMRSGDAWPMGPTLARASGSAFVATWTVTVILPGDERSAVAWWDTHWADVFEALRPALYIERAEPVLMSTTNGDLLAFQLTGTAEE